MASPNTGTYHSPEAQASRAFRLARRGKNLLIPRTLTDALHEVGGDSRQTQFDTYSVGLLSRYEARRVLQTSEVLRATSLRSLLQQVLAVGSDRARYPIWLPVQEVVFVDHPTRSLRKLSVQLKDCGNILESDRGRYIAALGRVAGIEVVDLEPYSADLTLGEIPMGLSEDNEEKILDLARPHVPKSLSLAPVSSNPSISNLPLDMPRFV